MNQKAFEDILNGNPFILMKDAVYEFLYNQIISMEIAPGTGLNASSIAKTLNVSRSPVQAALMQLERDNLIVRKKGKRMQVAPVLYSDCCALAAARIGIETTAAYYLATDITQEQLHKLQKILNEYSKLRTDFSMERYVRLDDAFHTAIVEFTDNPYLINAYQSMRGSIMRYRWYMSPKIHHGKLEINEYNSHYSIYKALEGHHAALARDEMRASLDRLFAVTYYLNT